MLPVTDMVMEHDLSYVKAGDMLRGGFDFGLVFRWIPARKDYTVRARPGGG